MPTGGLKPALLEAAYEAKQQHHELVLMELPVLPPGGEGPPSAYLAGQRETGDFLFRLLTFGEFDTFSRLAQLGDVSEVVMKTALVYPDEQWDLNEIQYVETGAFDEAAGMIIDMSGFEGKAAMFENLNSGRNLSGTVYGAAQMFICKAFPSITPRDVTEMSMPEMFRYVAMAEQMLAQEGQAAEFPLREFFREKKHVPKGHIPKDFSRLRPLTEAQIEAMKAGGRAEAVANATQARRALAADPEGRARRSQEIRRRKMAEIAAQRELDVRRGADEESAALSKTYRPPVFHEE